MDRRKKHSTDGTTLALPENCGDYGTYFFSFQTYIGHIISTLQLFKKLKGRNFLTFENMLYIDFIILHIHCRTSGVHIPLMKFLSGSLIGSATECQQNLSQDLIWRGMKRGRGGANESQTCEHLGSAHFKGNTSEKPVPQ